LPRRLGDDPLTRAKDERARVAADPAPAAADSGSQAGVSHPETFSLSRASYNDVFFQRTIAQQQLADARATPEASEISEISEIPEIREVAAAPNAQPVHATPVELKAASGGAHHTHSAIEEAVARLNESAVSTAASGDAAPQVKNDVPSSTPSISQVPDGTKDEPQPEPQKSGGFFKRLFGKFGK
jgi:hypothetical protein